MRKGLIFLLSFCVSMGAKAQLSTERQAVSRMQKGKWKGAEETLRKSLRKDTLNPEARYLLSIYYFATENPARNIDSAYYCVLHAISSYGRTTSKEKERL